MMIRIKYQEAAGLEVKRGRPSVGLAPSKAVLIKLYVQEEKSIREVAVAMGCSKDAVHRALRKFGIKTRTCAKRGSALLQYKLSDMKAIVKKKGVRGYARELGICEGTLRHHLRVREKK